MNFEQKDNLLFGQNRLRIFKMGRKKILEKFVRGNTSSPSSALTGCIYYSNDVFIQKDNRLVVLYKVV